jgi:hypothetical protein
MSSSSTSSGLQGTLATVPFSDLLQLLSAGRKTGTLTLRNGRHVKRIFFRDGEIISSSSDDPAEFLGQFLLYQGKISEEQLKKALENQEKTGILIGKILVMVGAMTEKDVVATLVQKAEETVFSLFLWEGGTFAFEEGNLPKQTLIPISLKVQDILLEGAKALDDLQRIRQEFRSGRAILRRTRNAAPPAALKDRLSAAIYRRLDGNLSIPDLCLEFRCSELSASKALYTLYQQGYVEVIGAAAAEAPPAESTSIQALIAKGQELQAQGQLGPAIDHLRRALIMSPSDAKLREMVERAEAQFLDKAHQHLLPPHKIPVLRMSLETLVNENLSPEEGFLVSRINGTWDLKSIISISPLREVDALRCVDRLRRRGILELREPPPKPADDEEEAPAQKPLAPVTD